MHFHDPETRPEKELTTGVRARTFWGEKIMLVVVDLDANASVPSHSHPHEQAGMVLEGEIEFTIAGETRLVHTGDLYMLPGDVPHSVIVGPNPVRLLDIFTPVREEYKY